MEENNNNIVIYQTDDGMTKIDVKLEDETVWLSQNQMAELFNSSRTNIIEHINKSEKQLINELFSNFPHYSDEELDKNSTCQDFRQVRKEGKRTVTRTIPFYNLDMIKGYVVNQKRLKYLEKTVKLIDIAGRIDINLKGNE